MKRLIDKLHQEQMLTAEEFHRLLANRSEETDLYARELANQVRQEVYGNKIYVRGLIEFTNYCKNDCYYCGIRRSNQNAQRYRLTEEDILECCRHSYDDGKPGVKHLVYASSSSIYGLNKEVPYRTEDKTDKPVSLYAATKKSNELLAHAYSKLYRIPCTGLRFFTVYGPCGRPDMAYFGFTNKMVKGEKIQLFNYGDMYRDFTYIDDIVKGVSAVMEKAPDANEDGVRVKVYNIGNHQPVSLKFFVETLENCLRKAGVIDNEAEKEFLPMQPGDVYQTYADVSELEKDFGFKPDTPLEVGLTAFAEWYAGYYRRK